MRILFMGTPNFALPALEMLTKKHNVVAVVTQPDKPKGRKMELTSPPVKDFALSQGIEVYQSQSLKDEAFLQILQEKNPDLIVVIAYGKLLPPYILNFPKHGCINVHASLLPKYRGAAPIAWSIINGEQETGVTTMFMDKGLDTGDIIQMAAEPIEFCDTHETLHDKLSILGSKVLSSTIESIEDGTIKRIAQGEVFSYAPILTKETGRIDWNKTAVEVYNLVRGLNPWPCAFGVYKGESFKILECSLSDKKGKPGEIVSNKNELIIACKEGAISVDLLQFEGRKRMSASQYLAGHKIEIGVVI